MKSEDEPWLIYTKDEQGCGGVYLWWKPKAAGYTVNLSDAGRFTEAEAKKYAAGMLNVVPVSWADVAKAPKITTVPVGPLGPVPFREDD